MFEEKGEPNRIEPRSFGLPAQRLCSPGWMNLYRYMSWWKRYYCTVHLRRWSRVACMSGGTALGNVFCFFCSVHSFFCTLKKKNSGIDKSTEWSTIPACPSLMCVCVFLFFLNRGNILRKFSVWHLCIFCYICKFVSGLILWFWGNCGLVTCVKSK